MFQSCLPAGKPGFWRVAAGCFLLLFLLHFLLARGHAQNSEPDRTPTGFYYPTGSMAAAHSANSHGWLERDQANGGAYYRGFYHVGQDIPARGPQGGSPGAPVYAIAAGEVTLIAPTGPMDNLGLGAANAVMVVRHRLKGGRRVLAVYMHVRPRVPEKDSQGNPTRVKAGQKIATVGSWKHGPHLHFAIAPGPQMPHAGTSVDRGWGNMRNGSWPNTNGFVDPIPWLEDPGNEPDDRPWNTLARPPRPPAKTVQPKRTVKTPPPAVRPAPPGVPPRPPGGSPLAPAGPGDARTPAGFYYPTGSSAAAHSKLYYGWLERDEAHGGAYYGGYYHTGQDIPAAGPKDGQPGAPVYAIADGRVVLIRRSDAKDSLGIGPGNAAVFIKHSLQGGRGFLALYMHVRPMVPERDSRGRPYRVKAGEKIATVGPWKDGPHVHFAVSPGPRVPEMDGADRRWWGRMGNAHWPDTNGFVDPIRWIESPANVPEELGEDATAVQPTPAPAPSPSPNPSPTPASRTGRRPGEARVNRADGAPMVYVPPGEFTMGSQDGQPDEQPVHRVKLTRGFWMYRTEVTNAQYRKFAKATGRQLPLYAADLRYGSPELPVQVWWADAAAYAQWAGGRLPTEAEWEFAARGPEGRRFPWGSDPPKASRALFGLEINTGRPGPVGRLKNGAGPFGALDMAGNVSEWCQDFYDATYYRSSRGEDPPGPADGATRVVRGGNWFSRPGELRAANRFEFVPDYRGRGVGIRVVVPE